MSQPSEIIAPLQSTSGVVPTTGNTSDSSGNLSEVPSTQAGSGANLTPPTTSVSAKTSTERDLEVYCAFFIASIIVLWLSRLFMPVF